MHFPQIRIASLVIGVGLVVAIVATVARDVSDIVREAPPPGQPDMPNVLLIVTDDQQAGTLYLMPAVRTWLVRQGSRFSRAFATTPLCCPSRASLLTGLMAHNHGITQNHSSGSELAGVEQLMFQSSLREGGYRTGIFGKYLNPWPVRRDPTGWDRWAISENFAYSGEEWNIDGSLRVINRNSTLFVTDRTLDFMRGSEERDAQPWFAYVAYSAPHLPSTVPAAYRNLPVPPLSRSESMNEVDVRDKPRWVRRRPYQADDMVQGKRGPMLRSLIPLDDQIRRLMVHLDDMNELRDSLIVFTSDNGYMWGDHHLRGKQAPYLPSVRVPLVMRWPGHISAGDRDHRIVALMDLAPTILMAANATFPHKMDGLDLLAGERRRLLPLEFWRDETSTRSPPTWRAVVGRDVAYVEYLDRSGTVDDREFYNLAEDPHQLSNVLRDGTKVNDPNLTLWHRRVVRGANCAGEDCALI